MKILIVNPPSTQQGMFTLRDEICFQDVKYVPFPIRLAVTAAMVRDLGHEVSVIDANATRTSWEELDAMLTPCDVLITQSAAGVLDHDMQLFTRAKKCCGENFKTLMIETVISPIFPERVMNDYPDCDILVRSQLERVILDLFTGDNFSDLSLVKGIVYRDAHADIKIQEESLPLSAEELSDIPFMAYDLLPMKLYSISYLDAPLHERVIPGIRIRTARDCPFKCPFCIIGSTASRGYDAKLRAMEAVRAADEIEHVVKTYNLKGIFFWDETFTYNRKRAKAFLEELIKRDLGIVWRCLTRVDCLDEELVVLMAKAGCKMIEFGMESGDPEGRKSHHKGFSNEKAIETVALVRKHGILVNCDFIIGMPWDSWETVKKTEELAIDLRADGLHLTIAFPYPETELYKIADEEKLLEIDDIYDTMVNERVRVKMKSMIRTRHLSSDEVLEAWEQTRKAINKIYTRRNVFMRPWAFWPVVRHAEGPGHLLRMVPKAIKLLTGGMTR